MTNVAETSLVVRAVLTPRQKAWKLPIFNYLDRGKGC